MRAGLQPPLDLSVREFLGVAGVASAQASRWYAFSRGNCALSRTPATTSMCSLTRRVRSDHAKAERSRLSRLANLGPMSVLVHTERVYAVRSRL